MARQLRGVVLTTGAMGTMGAPWTADEHRIHDRFLTVDSTLGYTASLLCGFGAKHVMSALYTGFFYTKEVQERLGPTSTQRFLNGVDHT